ncbi:TPA: hypothetical protein JLK88_001743 [Escherichia coli]|nr:hypothetical protein [Escherichia coli]
MNLVDRIIQIKCENNPVFRERYLRKLKQVKSLDEVRHLMRRGENDLMAREAARQAIYDAVDLLLLHPEAVDPIYDLVKAAHKFTWQPAPKLSEPLNDSDLDQQIEDEF